MSKTPGASSKPPPQLAPPYPSAGVLNKDYPEGSRSMPVHWLRGRTWLLAIRDGKAGGVERWNRRSASRNADAHCRRRSESDVATLGKDFRITFFRCQTMKRLSTHGDDLECGPPHPFRILPEATSRGTQLRSLCLELIPTTTNQYVLCSRRLWKREQCSRC